MFYYVLREKNFPRTGGKILLLLGLNLLYILSLSAQTLPPCGERPTIVDFPRSNTNIGCMEEALHVTNAGIYAFTSLAISPDGTVYSTRPFDGEIWRMVDTDDDFLPDTVSLVTDGLTFPNGITYHDESLYVSGENNLYRIDPENGETVTLVDDVPFVRTGYWTGGVVVGEDERIYIGTGAPCDDCLYEDTELGAVISYALDGSDKRVIARGFRYPADLTWHRGELWVIDTTSDALANIDLLDEVNRVVEGEHYGYPYCAGESYTVIASDEYTCENTVAPEIMLESRSIPIGIASYDSPTFPELENSLLVAMMGSNQAGELRGYNIYFARFDDEGNPATIDLFLPYNPTQRREGITNEEFYYRGGGFWANSPLDVAVSPQGWIYVIESGGRILAFRPR